MAKALDFFYNYNLQDYDIFMLKICLYKLVDVIYLAKASTTMSM
jgi:hypothetical protein